MPRLSRSISIVGLLLIAGALALDHASLHAQAPAAKAPLPFGALEWRSIGPARGGRSIAVAGSAARPNEYYFGATGGGLWKTTNGGVTWRPSPTTRSRASSVGAVAVAPSNPDIVYIGTGESEHPRQHRAGRRRLQVDRRRQDVDARRPRGQRRRSPRSASTRPTRTSSSWRRSATRRDRTRTAASSARRTAARRGRRCSYRDDKTGGDRGRLRSEQPERALRGAVGGVPHPVHDVERRAGQRAVQVDRRRRPLDGALAQPGHAEGRARQDRRQRLAARFATASTRRSKPRTAACSGPTTRARRGRA